jgi:UDP-2,4-diacetamido-2,4,6-trideoxy-beta-L-altropyranose hydrolase
MGTGHVMRCLALAQAAQEQGHPVLFLSHQTLPDALHQRLNSEGMQVVLHHKEPGSSADAQHTIAFCQQHPPFVLVLDGYHFDADYQQRLSEIKTPFLMIDDNAHAEAYHADWILNQNIHADEQMYTARDAHTELLLGTQYALLRKEFWKWRDWQRDIPEKAKNVLITMGGSDPDNVTLKVLQTLESLPDAEMLTFRVVVGGSNPHGADLEIFAEKSDLSVELLHSVTDMPELMAWADVAISAGGSTVWELCMMGLPAIVMILADNQIYMVEGLAARDAIINLGFYTTVAQETIRETTRQIIAKVDYRRDSSHNMRKIVDGFGTQRVLNSLKQREC